MNLHNKLATISEMVNEDELAAASDLLHEVLVEQSRTIYRQVIESEELAQEQELEEALGGDEGEDFIGDIADADSEIDAEEFGAEGIEGIEAEGEAEEEDDASRIDDLEAQLAALTAEFEQLVADELSDEGEGEGEFDNFGEVEGDFEEVEDESEFGDEADISDESVFEATKFLSDVAAPEKGESGAFTDSVLTKSPTLTASAGEPVKIGKGEGQGKEADKTPSKTTNKSANLKLGQKSKSADLSGEGKYVGTGKGMKNGRVAATSPLTKRPKQ